MSNASILLRLIKWYVNREFKDYNPKWEGYITEARRKTIIEECGEIVEYCINNNRDYKGTFVFS